MRRSNPETPLYGQALDWAAAAGYIAWRQNSGRRGGIRFGFKGLPDIAGYHRQSGRALFIECKRDGERLTPEQFEFLSLALAGRCDAYVWTGTTVYTPKSLPARMKPKGTQSK